MSNQRQISVKLAYLSVKLSFDWHPCLDATSFSRRNLWKKNAHSLAHVDNGTVGSYGAGRCLKARAAGDSEAAGFSHIMTMAWPLLDPPRQARSRLVEKASLLGKLKNSSNRQVCLQEWSSKIAWIGDAPELFKSAIWLKHSVLIEVCLVDVFAGCLRISTGFI